MKTKITLLVTVLAAALFGMGCASVPKPPVPHAVKWNGHWYAVFNDRPVIASEAQAICIKSGGHLVVISGKSENEFVKGLASSTMKFDYDYLIGLNRLSDKSWKWVDGEDYSKGFKNWGPAEEKGTNYRADEKYVGMWIRENDKASGQWASVRGNISLYFICEWE